MTAARTGRERTLAALALSLALLAAPLAGQADDPAEALARAAQAYDGGRSEEAAAIWSDLAAAGNLDAIVALASLYLAGDGVEQDAARAAALFREAAERGDDDGQLNLGRLHLEGRGVEQDPEAAYVWLGLAAAQGRSWAASRLEELRGDLDPAALARADERIAAFTPR